MSFGMGRRKNSIIIIELNNGYQQEFQQGSINTYFIGLNLKVDFKIQL